MATEQEQIDQLKGEVSQMNIRLTVAESNIKGIQADISSIKDDTKWLRRAITNAIIVTVVGGVGAIIFAVLKGGL